VALRELSLFAGAGGGILGSKLLGWRTVCAVEIDPYCRSVLLQRQIDGILETFPIWDDIRTFNPAPWIGEVDIITGGFPCQGLSSAGKRRGLADPRSGLVFEMLWAINVIRPQYVLAENSPNLRTHGLGSILGSLDSMGYDARWGVLGARHVGAPHRRDRLWIVATDSDGKPVWQEQGRAETFRENTDVLRQHGGQRFMADSEGARLKKNVCRGDESKKSDVGSASGISDGWTAEPSVGRVAHGVAHRMDRLKALGNGQVPRVAALAWEVLCGRY